MNVASLSRGYLKLIPLTAALASCTSLASMSQAAILTPTGVTASTEFGGRPALNTINSSGLSGGLHDNSFSNMWMSSNADANAGTVSITWDLGSLYLLSGYHLWNYNENSGLSTRGIASGTIQVAQDAGFTLGLQTFTGQTFIQAPSTPGYAGEDYALSALGRYVRFSSLTHFPYPGGQGDQSNYIGISEIRFDGIVPPPPVAEPTSSILFGMGTLVMLGLKRRHRNEQLTNHAQPTT